MNGKVTVLIAEDSPTQLESLRFILEEAGFSVVAVANGREGLEAAKANQIDLAISDIMMPEMDGYAFCRALRADVSLQHMPVIMLTSLTDPRDVIQGLESGANNFICKPYEAHALLSRVQNVLANQAIRKTSSSEMGINIQFAGQRFFITADRLQILDLLLSTYENAVSRNRELIDARDQLRDLNEHLEAKVAERTMKLDAEIAAHKRTEEMLAAHIRISATFGTVSSDELYNEVLGIILEIMDSPIGFFGYFEENGCMVVPTMLRPAGDKGETPHIKMRFSRKTWGKGEWSRAVREKRTIMANEPYADISERHIAIQKYVSVPILLGDEVVGLLQVANRETDYTKDDVSTLEELVSPIAPLLEARLQRERAQEALRESERRLNEAQSLGRVGNWEYDIDEQSLTWSDQTYKLYERDPASGPPSAEEEAAYYSAEQAQALREYSRLAIETGQDREYNIEARLPDGGFRFFAARVHPSGDAKGRVIRLLGTVQDITEQKRGDELRRASELRYRRLFEAARDGILILDADSGTIIDVNPFLAALTGHVKKEFMGKHLWEVGAFKDIDASKAKFEELLAKKYVRYDDLPLKSSDGRMIDVEFVSNAYTVDHHEVIQCNIRDISARVRAQEDAVKASREWQQTFDSIVDVIWILDDQNRILRSNRTAEGFFDRTITDMIGKDCWEVVFGAAEAIPEQRGALLKKYLKRETSIVRRGGQWLEITVNPIMSADGRYDGAMFVLCDITERKKIEEDHERLAEQLRASQKLEAIGSLAGGIAHDFNNLLTVILSYSRFVIEAMPDGEPMKEDLLEVRSAAERATALTRQLLAFSRKQVLEVSLLNLNEIVAGTDKMLRRLLGEDIELSESLEPGLGMTLADPSQIEQVLMNLVVNARDSMLEGGKLTIETRNAVLDDDYASSHSGVKPGRYVQLTISDSGCGMDEQTKARIFEPFFTTKGLGKGTGLGLSTVYGIVKQSGGNIWVYSELGHGTTFKIYLPLESGATAVEATKIAMFSTSLRGNETILVVEDEEALRKIAIRTLEAVGYTVLLASDGEDALRISAQYTNDIHLVLTDVVMPRLGGRQLVQRLMRKRPAIKIIYMSGYTDDAIVNHGVLDAGTNFIGKPFSSKDLQEKVRKVLDEDANTAMRERDVYTADEYDMVPFDKEALRALSPAILSSLREASIAARYDDIVQIIGAIRIGSPGLAGWLMEMADKFDYQGIINSMDR
ncbi:MAG TPA: response regulator [bacterium]|nr:response regulator [bacterium]